MAIQNVLLVAGFNYENVRNPTFLQCCNSRMARLLSKARSGADLVVTLLDVGGGAIKESRVDPRTKKRSWKELKRFNPVTTANYSSFVTGRSNHFDTNPNGVMSITDIYDTAQAIGAGPERGTLTELSFFSHGWMGGPILVNSFDVTANDPSRPRDPTDKDARLFKDFVAPNMNDKAIGHFGAAFAPTGFVWTWGCSFSRAAHIVLAQIFKTSRYRSTPRGKLKDSDTFTLDFSVGTPTPTAQDLDTIVTIVPGGKRSGRSYTVNVSFLEIKNAFAALLANTYCAKVAENIGVFTFGALPGTYADEEKNVRLPLMIVPTRVPPYDDDLTATLRFYTTYMGVALDPENRGYGTF